MFRPEGRRAPKALPENGTEGFGSNGTGSPEVETCNGELGRTTERRVIDSGVHRPAGHMAVGRVVCSLERR